MKNRNLILLVVWLVVVGVALALCFKTYVLDENFRVLTFTSCNPEAETCFVFECHEDSDSYPAELCRDTADGEKVYYTYIYKKKHEIASCDATEDTCEPLTCSTGEEGCERVVCDSESLGQEFVPVGAECSIFIPLAPEKVEEKEPEPVLTPDTPATLTPIDTVPTDEPLPPQLPTNTEPVSPTPATSPSQPTTTKPEAPLYDPSIIDTSL